MKRIAILLSVLAAFLTINALPAFSVTGPYGNLGPGDYAVKESAQHVAMFSGTGPYGVFGPSDNYGIVEGGVQQTIVFAGGTGPYGGFISSGRFIEPWITHFANREQCLLVAMNCPTE